jgi:hypothetical protein
MDKKSFSPGFFCQLGVDDYCSQNRCFTGRDTGYEQCFQILLDTHPDILMAAHWGPLPVSPEYLRKSMTLFRERQGIYDRLFPHKNANFGLDHVGFVLILTGRLLFLAAWLKWKRE